MNPVKSAASLLELSRQHFCSSLVIPLVTACLSLSPSCSCPAAPVQTPSSRHSAAVSPQPTRLSTGIYYPYLAGCGPTPPARAASPLLLRAQGRPQAQSPSTATHRPVPTEHHCDSLHVLAELTSRLAPVNTVIDSSLVFALPPPYSVALPLIFPQGLIPSAWYL
jgi:hypothetical protein